MHLNPIPVPLPAALRARAERFFRADFEAVRLSVDAVPARLQAAAVARGDTIHLAPFTAHLSPRAQAELIGHELAHVVQQRQGRAAAHGTLAGLALDDDASLEAEARELGHGFVNRPADRPPPPGSARHAGAPVAQRAVSVAGTAINQVGGLSERARLVLALIDGGTQWLTWAAAHPSARYDFADEVQLAAAVQSGLHTSPLALLPGIGLWVSPTKLMTLRASDLRTLARAERGDGGTVVETQKQNVLKEHGLVTQGDLASVTSFLGEFGIADKPVVSAMGLDAQLAIHELIQGSRGDSAQDHELQQEAATFAVKQARTPFELVDFYKFYVIYVSKLGLAAGPARAAAADAAVQQLQPLLFDALDAPQVTPQLGAPVSAAEVARMVNGWLGLGKQLGFPRLSAGIVQIIENSRFEREAGDAAKVLVHGYLQQAQTFLALNEPLGGHLGQDGVSCVFRVEGEGARAELAVAASGVLTLRSFAAAPSKPAPVVEEPESAPAAADPAPAAPAAPAHTGHGRAAHGRAAAKHGGGGA